MKTYRAMLKHDRGLINLDVVATSEESAIKIIMEAERCPRNAIVRIRPLDAIKKAVSAMRWKLEGR